MKKTLLLLTLCFAAAACKKIDVNFDYSPSAPRAGEAVKFSNLSSSGEDWEWSFGDGVTSTLRSPSHTYKRPGTYVVSLQVDKKKSLRATRQITVFDTVPTFVCADSTFLIYTDYTFTANVYNPYNYRTDYTWTIGENDSLVSVGTNSLTCYFTVPDDSAEVTLQVVLNGDTTLIARKFYIQDYPTNSVYIRTAEGDYRQRIFGDRAERPLPDFTEAPLYLDQEQDTAQLYNGYLFTLSELQSVFPDLQGFHIINRKIYCRLPDGLWVSNIDGAYPVQIDGEKCYAMTLDALDNRIYWANDEGVWYMPFVGSDNNKFVTVPKQLNALKGVQKLATDSEKF